MPPTAFASREPLPDDAPFRAPRPSRLREPLVAPHKKAGDALEALDLHTVGDEHRAALGDVVEPLPARLRVVERLPDRPAALGAVHFGPDSEEGRRRLAFDELLLVQLLFWRRRARHAVSAAPVLDQPGELTSRWLRDVLPFTPTDDQRSAMEAVDADLAREHPMQRLLMGEVSSRSEEHTSELQS